MKNDADRDLVATLAALAQATRIAILRLVSRAGTDGVAAGDIARSTGTPPSTLSFHLKEMTQAGLLRARTQGRFIYYSLDDKALQAAITSLGSCLGTPPVPPVEPVGRVGRKAAAKSRRGPGGSGTTDDGQMNIFGD